MWTKFRSALSHAGALAAGLLFGLPLLWVLSFSLRQPGLAPPVRIEWLPTPIVWQNYAQIFTTLPLGAYALNSLAVVLVAVPLTLLSASWAGFAMAQLAPAVRARLILLAVVLLIVPANALWLPRFLIFTRLGLIDTYWPLVAPALMGSSPFFVLLFYWTFRRVPSDLFEAARLEGAGVLRIWWSVALPLARPTALTVAVLSFSIYWNDFIGPLLYLKSDDRYTLPVGLQLLQQMDRSNWPFLMAAAVLASAPIVALFLTVQRYFWPEGRTERAAGSKRRRLRTLS